MAKKAASSRAKKTSGGKRGAARTGAVKRGAAKKGGAKRGGVKKGGAKKTSARRSTAKRERLDTGTNKAFAKRTTSGRFKEMDDVGRSQRVDQRRSARKTTKSGFGDQGDRKRSGKKR